jgi:hypothetical protein
VGHLPQEVRFEKLAEIALTEIASVDMQLIRNIVSKHANDVWKLHEKETLSVSLRVRLYPYCSVDPDCAFDIYVLLQFPHVAVSP